MRLLRRHVVTVRKPRVCRTCCRPIEPGEMALKTEWAVPAGPREGVECEYDCCEVNRAPVRQWTGHNVWGARSYGKLQRA